MRGFLQDTIVAPATAAGAAGLSVLRICGPEALAIGSRVFQGADLQASESHRAHHGWVTDSRGERIDEVLALVLRAPRGYTGEDTIELSCHGSPQVVQEILVAAVEAGARLAEPGEFTRRAFLNGRLDLCQAEAVLDLIAASSRAGRRAALAQLSGRLSERFHAVRSALVGVLADVEASIDFVEEGIEFFGPARLLEIIGDAAMQIDVLLATAADGQVLRAGVHACLAGAPNVGKSSVFNRLLEEERSIVTEHPGTTRDVVRETLQANGLAFVLEDTAGVRDDAHDPVERLGIERSRRSHAAADVVLQVLDASQPLGSAERAAVQTLDPEAAIVILNKIDLLPAEVRQSLRDDPSRWLHAALGSGDAASAGAAPQCVALSATTGEGMPLLSAALGTIGRVRRLALQNDALVCIAPRHREALVAARTALAVVDDGARGGEPPELLAVGLRSAVEALGELSGESVHEEILDQIFARFCIGK